MSGYPGCRQAEKTVVMHKANREEATRNLQLVTTEHL